MIFFRINKYLKYTLLSRHKKGHGIHSPFVFDLISRLFRNKIDPGIVFKIEKIRKRMLSDHRSIVVNDLGAGSERMKTNLRRVSDIAKYSPVPEKYGALLANMAAEFGEPMIVELGTSLGISTMYMASSCRGAVVYTIEGSQTISGIASENFREAGLENIKIINGSFRENIPAIFNDKNNAGLVFVDGDHRKEPLLDYFNTIAEVSCNKTVIIIDDIYYSKEMEEAWNEIKRNKKVSVTVDIYRMGIVFFREGISHMDYVIRY
ncbi:MAG TPA: class I SAM-dependent methyltransferase [Bacteroidales bacterium]|nr:class I SAM-dependent methyltransferase [Bacteroidales bacterium]HPT21763.1 class I SAM-dependent methyltransferase [Bacteroidales bacterium]